jgi:hypothetical protein
MSRILLRRLACIKSETKSLYCLSYTPAALDWREQLSPKVRSASPHQHEDACLGNECAFPVFPIRVIIAPLSTQVPSVGVYFGVPVVSALLHLQFAKRQKPAFRRGSAGPRRRKNACTSTGRVWPGEYVIQNEATGEDISIIVGDTTN